MQLSAAFALVSALAATALAGYATVENKGSSDVYLTITLADQTSTQYTIHPDDAFSEAVVGEGNSWGLTTNSDYYSPNTPKLIWGFSDSDGTVYYSVNTVDGNPFASSGFALTTDNAGCSNVNSPDARTRTCPDSASFTLTVN